jgi:dihydrofolate synthase/folylpolyglutamate synthase
VADAGARAALADALRWLYGLEPRGIRLDLDRMRAALAARGQPQRGLRAIHVAGTNGKGSVSACCDAALRAAGLRAGLYTSPHLHRFAERIRVDGRLLGDRALLRRITEIRRFLESPEAPALTFFEATTLLAFEALRDARVDAAVIEVGLGGRLDATNVLDAPLVSVITRIALDHQAYLGDTRAAIAGEKAGIAKAGAPLVLGAREPDVREVVEAAARAVGAGPLWRLGDEVCVEPGRGERFAVRTPVGVVRDLRTRLPGAHQRDNAALAVAALHAARARGLSVDDDALRAGLARVRWPARLERVRRGDRTFLFDAAHNPDGCDALAAYLRGPGARLGRAPLASAPSAAAPRGAAPLDPVPPGAAPADAAPPGAAPPGAAPRRVLLFGAMADKDHAQMLAALAPEVDAIVLTRPATPRAAAAEALARALPRAAAAAGAAEARPSPRDALARAVELAGPRGLVVVAGSIYLLAEVRAAALGLRADPPIAM